MAVELSVDHRTDAPPLLHPFMDDSMHSINFKRDHGACVCVRLTLPAHLAQLARQRCGLIDAP